ncbi:uncharacterized protein FMAN_11103 [Fusarium mangiferae]|uniref:Uncharacterized protein n=1 Tax=Fusarium mangiferae TaxID=192010 RepID=A0A1L7TDV8_FUSMA|nr:uncharacterized protein FMAN_11103 [Fusarium mangiferae]CVK96774.1 uncharacterized protein FMAN_11103 [Fusarium mangiferae]
MSQTQFQLQEAAAEIMRAAKVDGPDRFWPELEPELKLFAALGYNGQFDLRFENPTGAKVMNAMLPSDVCPGAIVYHGTKEGIYKAKLTASFLSDAQAVYIQAINVSQRFEAASRTANLRLRVADLHEHVRPRDNSSTSPLDSSGPLAVFLLPFRKETEFASCGYKVEKKALVLEEEGGGANKWGCQLGHIKAAQMNGVGQHVFFGPLESV